MSLEINPFKKLAFLPVYLASFFFSSTPLDEQCSDLSLENPNLMNRSQKVHKEEEKLKAASCSSETLKSTQIVDRPLPDAPSRTRAFFGKVLYLLSRMDTDLPDNASAIAALFTRVQSWKATILASYCYNSACAVKPFVTVLSCNETAIYSLNSTGCG